MTLLLVSLTLLACQPSIEVLPKPSAPTAPPATIVPPAHALAVMGVDFDPPLDSATIASGAGVTLLVAVENQGQNPEANVRVTARLLDAEVGRKSAELLLESTTIRSLPAGEVTVVRFTQVTDLPVRSRYALVVEVAGVLGEQDLRDNRRTYDIVVHAAE